MKKINKFLVSFFAGSLLLSTSACVKDLLDQQATTELDNNAYWQTEADAVGGAIAMYNNIKNVFHKDYFFDGHGDYVRVRAVSSISSLGTPGNGGAYWTGSTNGHYYPEGYGSSFDNMFRFLYGGVNRANYVIDNVTNMLPRLPASRGNLEGIIGEARLMRALVYFRLITMWGDVPYIDKIVVNNDDVISIPRTPIEDVKNHILADLDYAFEKLPATRTPDQKERVTKAAALALKGKVNLYWGSWNKNGWPELDTFTPDAAKADQAFRDAAEDFRKVINDYGLTLFRGGAPGEIDDLGKAETLPNYFHLFLPTSNANNETIIGFTHGGPGSGVSDKLMRDIGPRETESSEVNVSPNYWLADRYQSTTTGDFLPPMEQLSDRTQDAKYAPDADTRPNSALNPQTYLGRDYRMKSTILWNGEVIQRLAGLQAEGLIPYHHGKQGVNNGVRFIDYNSGTNSGYLFRKFVRNYAGQGREEGNMTWPVIRLADVYLMFAEASNEAFGPTSEAVTLVDKVRARGNLPGLKPEKYANRSVFFDAIEQERIVELVLEGHRAFDIRRWRKIEEIWGPPNGPGKFTTNTWGNNVTAYFQNKNERAYQQCYIFKIPQSEMDRNPSLRQNAPYL